MTSTLNPERATIPTEPRRAPLRRRPLMWLAALMAIATVATVALMIVDPREITGVNGCAEGEELRHLGGLLAFCV